MSTQPLAVPFPGFPRRTSSDRPAVARRSLSTLTLAVAAGFGFGLLAIVVIWAVAQVGLATHVIGPRDTTPTTLLTSDSEPTSLTYTLGRNLYLLALTSVAAWLSVSTLDVAPCRYRWLPGVLSFVGIKAPSGGRRRGAPNASLPFAVSTFSAFILVGYHAVEFGLSIGGLSNGTYLTPFELLAHLPHAAFEWPGFAMPLGLLFACARAKRRPDLRRCLLRVLCLAGVLLAVGATVETRVTPNYLTGAVRANQLAFSQMAGDQRARSAVVVPAPVRSSAPGR